LIYQEKVRDKENIDKENKKEQRNNRLNYKRFLRWYNGELVRFSKDLHTLPNMFYLEMVGGYP
jgi:hypothetical protein